jgi:hypothetical protein
MASPVSSQLAMCVSNPACLDAVEWWIGGRITVQGDRHDSESIRPVCHGSDGSSPVVHRQDDIQRNAQPPDQSIENQASDETDGAGVEDMYWIECAFTVVQVAELPASRDSVVPIQYRSADLIISQFGNRLWLNLSSNRNAARESVFPIISRGGALARWRWRVCIGADMGSL